VTEPDQDREVPLLDDDLVVLPDETVDDTDEGWGEVPDERAEDERLVGDRPPHWA